MIADMNRSKKKSVGVVLCTYNGEKYLGEQLESVLAQTRQPDKILILDDRSKDRTALIARDFEKKDKRIKISVNESNLGFIRNFEKGITLCDTDLIALCDQDDVWFNDKLERLSSELEAHPGAGMVFCNAEYMLANGTRTRHLVYDKAFGLADDAAHARSALFHNMSHKSIYGNLMLLESGMKNLILPNPVARSLAHDAWICLNAFFLRSPRYIAEPLSFYRLHPDQASGAVSLVLKDTPYQYRKKWYDHRRLARNIKRTLLSPFKRHAIVKERELRAYNYAIDMLMISEKLLTERHKLRLPPLLPEEESFFRDLRGHWQTVAGRSGGSSKDVRI